MKFNSSFNIQNHKWSSVKNHIDRSFEDGKHQDYDSNPRVNRNLSRFNLSTDGKIKMVNGNPKFIKDNIRNRLYQKQTKTYLAEKTLPWIYEHNQTASVKKNPKRAIPLNQSGAWKKFHNKLNKGQRTLVFQVGNAEQNNQAIKAIEHAKGCGYKQAHNEWAHVTSKALFNTFKSIRSQQDKRHSAVYFQRFTTNVDEATKAQVKNNKLIQKGSDGIHIHVSAIGITSTHLDNNFNRTQAKMAIHKSGKKKGQKYYKVVSKPTFNLGRAICADEHVKYSRAFIRINGRKVNKSVHKAVMKMHSKYDPLMLHYVQRQCQKDLSDVPELQHIDLVRTGNPHHSEAHGAYVHDKKVQDFMKRFKIEQTKRIKASWAKREHNVKVKEVKIKQQKANRIRQQRKVHDLKKQYHTYYNRGLYHLHKLQHRNQHLTIQNTSIQKYNQKLEHKRDKLKKSNQHLSQIHDKFKSYNAQLLKQNHEQQVRLNKGTKDIQNMIPKLNTLTDKRDDLQEQNTNLGESNTELHAQSEHLQQRINHQDNTLADLKKKFAIINKNNKIIIKTIAKAVNERTTARLNQLKSSFKNGVARFNNKIDSIYNNTKTSWQHKLAQLKEAHATIKIPAQDVKQKLKAIDNKNGLTLTQQKIYNFAQIRTGQGDGDKPIKVHKSALRDVTTQSSEADDVEPTVVPHSSKSKFDKHASDSLAPDRNNTARSSSSTTQINNRATQIANQINNINNNDDDEKHKREIRAKRNRGLSR